MLSSALTAPTMVARPVPPPLPPAYSGFDPLPDRDRFLPEAVPFHWVAPQSRHAGDRARAVVVCLHGFTAMPYGVRPIAQACVAAGISAVAPLQPGHGYARRSDQTQIARMTRDLMLDAARREIARARQHYDWVGVYGDSMGGAIALTLAAEGLVEACAVTAPAIQLPWRGEVLCAILGWLNFSIPRRPKRRFYAPCYEFENSRAGAALRQIAFRARRTLTQITCPVFVAHSHRDRTVSPRVTLRIAHQVTGPVTVQWFDESGHVLPLDAQGAEVSAAIANFFATQTATSTTTSTTT